MKDTESVVPHTPLFAFFGITNAHPARSLPVDGAPLTHRADLQKLPARLLGALRRAFQGVPARWGVCT